jgi:hypothetical protein
VPVEGWREDRIVAFRCRGHTAADGIGAAQTLLSAFQPGVSAPLWIGLRGIEQRLTVIIGPELHRSPHYWIGPLLAAGAAFDIRIVVDAGMGPGGIMCDAGDGFWSSLTAASPWGAERLIWPERWTIGHAHGGGGDRPFRGGSLTVSATDC